MKISYTHKGEVIDSKTGLQLGFWEKQPDPVYAAGVFAIWGLHEIKEEAKKCFPRHNGWTHFRDEITLLEDGLAEHVFKSDGTLINNKTQGNVGTWERVIDNDKVVLSIIIEDQRRVLSHPLDIMQEDDGPDLTP